MPRAMLLSLLLALGACQRTEVPTGEDGGGSPPVAVKPATEPRAACPAGSALRGGAPPEQFEEWCEKAGGVLDGRSTVWHKNGQKAAEGDYREGVKTGRWAYWHENGKSASSGEYRDGKREGAWSFWFDSGKPAEEGAYRLGREHGRWTRWNEAGDKIEEAEYQDGFLQRK